MSILVPPSPVLLKALRKLGLSAESTRGAAQFVLTSSRPLERLGTSKRLAEAIRDAESRPGHGADSALIASLLMGHAGISEPTMQRELAQASLLHDIGLPGLGSENEEELPSSVEARKLHELHPLLGAHLLRQCGGFHPWTIEAVAVHHDWRNELLRPAKDSEDRETFVELVAASELIASRLTSKPEADESALLAEVLALSSQFGPRVQGAIQRVWAPFRELSPKASP